MSKSTKPLADKRAIVTAGASGIGRAIVERLLAAGASISVCDISDDAISELCDAEPGLHVSRADVADEAQVAQYVTAAIAELGGVDLLVNNAGIGGPAGPLEELPFEAWKQSINVNLNGAFLVTRQVLPHLKRQRAGTILNISTASTLTGLPLRTAYIASKAGLEGLTHTLAREIGPFNLRCNAILPGLIDNSRGRMLIRRLAERDGLSMETALERQLRMVSMRTLIQPSEIGDLVVFLASDAARHITGQLIAVDGNLEWEE